MGKGRKSASSVRKILEEALNVFAEKGFAAVTMEEIASRAEVNKALLYYHVGDKKTLFTQALLSATASLRESVQALATSGEPVEQRFVKLHHAFANALAQKPAISRLLLRMLLTERENIPDEVLRAMTTVVGVTVALVREGQNAGSFKPIHPLLVHILLVGSFGLANEANNLLDRFHNLGLFPDLGQLPPPNQLAADLAELLLAGLAAHGRTQ